MSTTTYRLARHKSANCYVKAYDDGRIELISYTTLVIRAVPVKMFEPLNDTEFFVPSGYNKDKDAYAIRCYGTFTQTTSTHITWFLNEYFPDVDKKTVKDVSGTDNVILASKKYRG